MDLIALIGGFAYRLEIPDNVAPEQALLELTTPGPANPSSFGELKWLKTGEGYSIRRDAIEALGVSSLRSEYTNHPPHL